MNKNQIITIIGGLLIVAVVAIIFFMARPGEEPTVAYTIESDDKTASLEIPKDALPEGIDKEDISITKRVGELPSAVYAVYDLAPDGLEFRKPITVTATIPAPPDGSIPMAILGSEDAVELLPLLEVSLRNKAWVVTAELSHFSYLILSEAHFRITAKPPEVKRKVGEKFEIELYIGLKKMVVRDYLGPDPRAATSIELVYFPPASINGVWTHGKTILKPTEDVLIQDREIEDFHYSTVEYTCVAAGKDNLVFDVDISYDVQERLPEVSGRPSVDLGIIELSAPLLLHSIIVECVESEKPQGVIGQPEEAAQPAPPAPEPEPEPEPTTPAPTDPNEARCTAVCGKGRYFPASSLEACSDTSQEFLCIQDKKACYDYLIPRGWQTDSNCCCGDPPIETYAGNRINCAKFTGWGINGYAVDKEPFYPFGASTKSAAECK